MVKRLNDIKIKRERILATPLTVPKIPHGAATDVSDCTSNAEKPTRFCNVTLLISQLSTDDGNPSYAEHEVLIENLIRSICNKRNHGFEIKYQGNTLVITFAECLSEAGKYIINNVGCLQMNSKPQSF